MLTAKGPRALARWCWIAILVTLLVGSVAAAKKNKKDKDKDKKLKDKCNTCHELVDGFNKGVEKTASDIAFRGKQGGWKQGEDNKFLGKVWFSECPAVSCSQQLQEPIFHLIHRTPHMHTPQFTPRRSTT